MEVGIQVSSLKPLLLTTEQVREACCRMSALGCKTLQLQWIAPSVPVEAVAQALKEHQLRSVSVQDFYDLTLKNPEYYIRLNAATGGTLLCVSRIPERLKHPQGLAAFVEELRQFQRELQREVTRRKKRETTTAEDTGAREFRRQSLQ